MNSINIIKDVVQKDSNQHFTAKSLMQNFIHPFPSKLREEIQNNFYIYSRERKTMDEKLSKEILLPIIKDIVDYIISWSFAGIEIKREYRKKQLGIIDEERYRIIEKQWDTNVGNWQNLVQNITDIMHEQDALCYIPLTQFFGVPVVEEKYFTPSDEYYYKGISLNILLTRQIVCEWYTYFDEYLDYITHDYEVAHDWYAHGSRRYFKPFNEWYVLCINKERLQNHVASLKNEHNEKDESYYSINVDHKNELYLYHSIVPISCVDHIIKIPGKVRPTT